MRHDFEELLQEAERTVQLAGEMKNAGEQLPHLHREAEEMQRLYDRAQRYVNLIIKAGEAYEETGRRIRNAASMETVIYPPTVFAESSFAELVKFRNLIHFEK